MQINQWQRTAIEDIARIVNRNLNRSDILPVCGNCTVSLEKLIMDSDNLSWGYTIRSYTSSRCTVICTIITPTIPRIISIPCTSWINLEEDLLIEAIATPVVLDVCQALECLSNFLGSCVCSHVNMSDCSTVGISCELYSYSRNLRLLTSYMYIECTSVWVNKCTIVVNSIYAETDIVTSSSCIINIQNEILASVSHFIQTLNTIAFPCIVLRRTRLDSVTEVERNIIVLNSGGYRIVVSLVVHIPVVTTSVTIDVRQCNFLTYLNFNEIISFTTIIEWPLCCIIIVFITSLCHSCCSRNSCRNSRYSPSELRICEDAVYVILTLDTILPSTLVIIPDITPTVISVKEFSVITICFKCNIEIVGRNIVGPTSYEIVCRSNEAVCCSGIILNSYSVNNLTTVFNFIIIIQFTTIVNLGIESCFVSTVLYLNLNSP